MIPDDVEALALADAIGALDPEERRLLDSRVAALPPDAAGEVARLYNTVLPLAMSAGERSPSPSVRQALLAKLAPSPNYTLTAADGEWIDPGLPRIRMKILALDRARDRVTLLIRAEAGARYPAHRHSAPEECYVVSGSVVIDGHVLRAGDFHHAEDSTAHGEITTDEGAEVLLVAAASDYLPGGRG
jgi:anti-sigma factor ChrR (cupin superfamily)